eukprot:gene4501-6359_t
MTTSTSQTSLSKQLQPFIVGGTCAMFASTIVHPIDLAKVRLQLIKTLKSNGSAQSIPTSFSGILIHMVKTQGITSIYSGLSAALMRQAVYGTARIGLHRSFSDELVRRNNNKPVSFTLKAASGMLSGSIAVCFGTPFDVTLVRMQGDSMKAKADQRGYKNVFDAIYRIAKEEGVKKLYSGLAPNILRGMSMNVGMLACYDQAKEMIGYYIMKEKPNSSPSLVTQLSASGIAGFTASFFSIPFDLLKSRMQDGAKYKGVLDAFVKVYTTEGLFSFWTGFSAYYMRTAPHAMILLMTQEPIKKLYNKMF